MSDLESVRRARDAIITEVAGGKLRSLARGGGDQASNEGLLDAFAEVFARMSESKMAAPTDEQTEPAEDLANPSSDSPLGSETESQNDDSHQQCIALKPDDLPTEDVELPSTSVVEIAALKEAAPQQGEDVQALAETDIEAYATAPVVAEVLDTEAETPEIAEEQVRQVLPSEDGEDVVGRRRKAKPTSDSKSADMKPLEGTRDGEVVTADNSESEIISAEIDDELEQPMEESGGEVRRNRRAHHRGGRHAEQSQAPVTKNGSREAASKVESMMNPEMLEASKSTDRTTPVGQARTAAAAVNRSVQAAAAASSVASTSGSSGSNTSRFGATPGNGIREVAYNPSVGATAKAANRPSADARGKKVDTTDTLARVKLIQRVSKAFQHLGPEGGVIRLRLAPAEMGSVRVEMRIQQRKVAARVIAETEAASAALREHLPDLRARLESFGMEVEQLDIETENLDHEGGSHFEDTTSRDEGWQEPDRRQQRERAKQFQAKNVVDVSQHVSPPVTTASLSAGIDVHL
ncbi:flagellar hook-length control protein FliK [Rubripirellula sp.]|nr:flagellar hook-length control protein FliK [Rubripirellula sp.]